MNRIFILIALWLAMVSHSSQLIAQTAEGGSASAKSDAEQKAEAERRIKEQEELEQKLKDQASKTNGGGEVFKPTEEISEDSPAPFPIDI